MRLLFAGSPAAAVPSLQALLASRHEVVAVLTRPDARVGRGRALQPSAVAAVARERGLQVLTPRSLRDPQVVAQIADLAVDAAPVVAYGVLVPADLLDVPRHGWVNLHFSLLPAWRGAAPVQHAVMAGDEVTGASTFRLEEGLDTGPVYGTLTETIRPTDTSGDLLGRLSVAGAELLVRTLDALEDGVLEPVPQPGDGVSHAPKLTVEDARVRWEHPAHAVDRRVRGCTPAPGAWTTLPDAQRLGLGPVRPVPEVTDLRPGEVRAEKHEVLVGTAAGAVRLGDVTAPGKRPMPAADWARGARLAAGTVLGAGAPGTAGPTGAAR
ncbi:methionyl-tRNA formyltransferase [Cellulomonas wangsupingiae]|uniref:Methionyl-tRNA formyltransferase n=1 Tax=Cellulomonas wangsupingiae TaxID=2968085 RepID=A0ABY5K4Q3_9CELL|nr:methionyl-tRNA formyltransferase [Cellulomonas wangsupingiae]MCC2333233.1 methionyl-tRNA formyltransferase [Cellulomonas wangsupingiae]MCM0638086.1 methionyl-tRNA formyltransferase [Cellulomonas wangsupingiae]UUI63443.1 methionyl-tRNA formyltransferase [Cellulomonas wangsupingiae]